MKTINLKIAIGLIVFLLSFLLVNKSFSQSPSCPFYLNTSISCGSVVAKVNFYDNSSSSSPCSTTQVTITINSPQYVSCGSCNAVALTNVEVILISINGGGITPTGSLVDINNNSASGTFGGPPCSGSNSWIMSWALGGADISF